MKKTGIERLTRSVETKENSEVFRGTLGFDFVFTRENGKLKCYCIEFNGENSTVRGIANIPKNQIESSHRTLADIRSRQSSSSREAEKRINDFVEKHEDHGGPLAIYEHLLNSLKKSSLSDSSYRSPSFFEEIAGNKKLQIPYIPEENSPKYWNPGDSTKSKNGHWVLKEVTGVQGRDVFICSDADLEDEAELIGEDVKKGLLVVQELIKSNDAEGAQSAQKNRAASMRLLMDFRYLEDGTIVSDFESAYQRVAPHEKNQTHDSKGEILSKEELFVVNKSQGAESAAASPMEIKMAREVAEEIIRRLATTHMKVKATQIKVDYTMPPLMPQEIAAKEAQQAVRQALVRIYERYEESEGHDALEFHNVTHTTDVIRRCNTIPGFIPDFGNRKARLAVLCAAFHDIVQNWKPIEITEDFNGKTFTKIMRKRFSGKNEEESADELIAFMRKVNKDNKTVVFSPDDEKIAKEAILATIPDFDTKRRTVFQPNLTKDSSKVARVLALADLGAAGLEPDTFPSEGDAIFREENLDISDALKDPHSIDEDHRAYFKHRMFEWTKEQPAFAKGRKLRFIEEITGLPKRAIFELKKLFFGFDESIQLAKQKVEERRNMSFEELAQDMGYEF